MKKIRAAVIGYGNIGHKALEALEVVPDFEIAGVVRRTGGAVAGGYPVVDDIARLTAVDVAIVCAPSRRVEETAAKILALGINTVDSFDIHSEIVPTRARLDEVAKSAGAVAVVAAGWDPGSDSVVRALLEACAPVGTTFTNFGPGMSMGHTVAAKAIEGVKNALSMTLPAGEGRHNRHVYIEIEAGADFATVAAAIKSDPYFAKDKTEVELVADVEKLIDVHHGVNIVRTGSSGTTKGQNFGYTMRINNPALTAQILVSAARAAMRQRPGAYTMIEIPVIDLLAGEREENIKRLV